MLELKVYYYYYFILILLGGVYFNGLCEQWGGHRHPLRFGDDRIHSPLAGLF